MNIKGNEARDTELHFKQVISDFFGWQSGWLFHNFV
jgi:hypothetical protein